MQDPLNEAGESKSPEPTNPPPPAPPGRPARRSARSRRVAEHRLPTDLGPEPLDLTRVLSQLFSTLFGNLHRMLLISLVVFSPILLTTGVYLAAVGHSDADGLLIAVLLALDLLFLHHIFTAALVSGLNRTLRGEPMKVGDSLKSAFSRIGAVLGLGWIVLAGLGLGSLLAILPGALVYTVWCAAFPALMEEQIGVRAALSRSLSLTKGSRLAIFTVLMMFLLAIYLGGYMALLPLGFLSMSGGPLIGFVITQFILIFARWLFAVLSAVIYHELQVEREGLEVEQLGTVFE